jgi:hypothetical protein
MKYLCLVYFEERALDVLSESESAALRDECLAYGDEIRRNGHWLGGEALQPVETATTLRVRDGTLSTTDGPFAETKEQLGGFYLIDARDMNEAVQVASKIPPARLGTVEVRPIRDATLPWRSHALR